MNIISKSMLKPKLLEYLRIVEKKNQSFIITDHGREVAKIIPFNNEDDLENDLKGSVLFFENPLGSVGEEDWELQL